MDDNVIQWIPFEQQNFADERYVYYSVDTRDFSCAADVNLEDAFDYQPLLKHQNRYFRTPEEVKNILIRLEKDSGGKAEWRCLWMKQEGKRYSQNWALKYLRIHRTPHGLVICDSRHKPIPHDIFKCEMADQDILATH